jgi:hypothetical protein
MKCKIIIVFCWVACAVNAQTATKVTWDYPVKPGMEEWKKFKSMDEMYLACQVPEDILKKLDTESLVKICFDFPAYMAMFFHNSPQAGFNDFYSNFNGVRELFNRKDVGFFMLNKYKAMSFADFNPLWKPEDQGRFVYKYQFFETLLAQPQIIQTLDSNGRKDLLKEAEKKFDMKLSRKDLFGGATFSVNAWIMAKTLDFENKLFSKFTKREDIELSLKSGQLADYDLMSIYQQSKNYSNGK